MIVQNSGIKGVFRFSRSLMLILSNFNFSPSISPVFQFLAVCFHPDVKRKDTELITLI